MKKRLIILGLIITASASIAMGCANKSAKNDKDKKATEQATEEADAAAEEASRQAEAASAAAELERQQAEAAAAAQAELEAAAAQAEAEAAAAEPVETTMYAKENVRVRKGPSTEDEIAGLLHTADEITVTGSEGEWSVVKWEDGTAYVMSEYLSDTKPEKAEEETAENNTENNTDANAAADKAAADKAAADAAAQAALLQQQQAAAAAAAAAATPANDPSLSAGYSFTEAEIAAAWNRTGAVNTGTSWADLGEGIRAACRSHYAGHGTDGW